MEEENKEKKKIILVDIKDVLIVLLILFSIFLFFKPFNTNEVDKLENDNSVKQVTIDSLQKEKQKLIDERKLIDKDLEKFKILFNLRGDTILFYRKISASKDLEIRGLKSDIDLYNDVIRRRGKQIDDLLKNPIILPKNVIVEKTSEKFK